jgi:thioesterase domain-containing protein
MNTKSLESYLHEHIPLSSAMRVRVIDASPDKVVLSAPLEPNINHIGTAFGGSESTLAILAAWSLLHVRLKEENISCVTLIQRHSIEYELPVPVDFTARAHLYNEADWNRFARTLRKHGKARIRIAAIIEYAFHRAASFEGDFVAILDA